MYFTLNETQNISSILSCLAILPTRCSRINFRNGGIRLDEGSQKCSFQSEHSCKIYFQRKGLTFTSSYSSNKIMYKKMSQSSDNVRTSQTPGPPTKLRTPYMIFKNRGKNKDIFMSFPHVLEGIYQFKGSLELVTISINKVRTLRLSGLSPPPALFGHCPNFGTFIFLMASLSE